MARPVFAVASVTLVACASGAGKPVSTTTAEPSSIPTATALAPPSRLQSAFRATCFLKANGHVVCWGTGVVHVHGEYKKPLQTPVAPVDVGLSDATQIAIDGHAARALRKSGEVACWGTAAALGGTVLEPTKAKPVAGFVGVQRLIGGMGICAIEASDQVACLDETSVRRTKLPVPVAEIRDVASADSHACLVTHEGHVHCWGNVRPWGGSELGALGGTPAPGNPFVQVPGIDDAVRVHAGPSHSCALRKAGTTACWGNGHDVPGGFVDGKYPVVTTKEARPWKALASGYSFRCTLSDQGVVCSGRNDHGQLGIGSTKYAFASTPVPLASPVAIAVGFDSACAAEADDTVSCWGANDESQLGDGTLLERRLPVKVVGLGGVEPPPPPKPGSGPPVSVALAKGPNAPWREADTTMLRSVRDDRYGFRRGPLPDAVGLAVAVFRPHGAVVDEKHGVRSVTWPESTQYLGVDGADAIYVGTKDALLRAADGDAAHLGSFTKVLALKDAVDFVATRGLVVAAEAKKLHVSKDGKTFTARNPPTGLIVEALYARPDVLAVFGRDAAGATALHLSKDAGVTFQKSSFQAPRFLQIGSLIYATGCPGGVLSADGATWAQRPYSSYGPSFEGWGEPLVLGTRPRAFLAKNLSTLVDPAPPPVPTGADVVTGAPGVCSGGGGGMGIGGGSVHDPGPCEGVFCLRGMPDVPPKGTATEVAFFGDGACAKDAKGLCSDGPWLREPHVSVGGKVVDVPAGCDPARLLTAGGIGVLFCNKGPGDYQLHTVDKGAKWADEGRVAFGAIEDLSIATDGTLVLHPVCPTKETKLADSCGPALVRKPVALGTAGAWRKTSTPRALAYRALPGGEVLVVAVTKAGDSTRFDLVVERPVGVETLVSGIALVDDLVGLTVEPGRIVVTHRASNKPGSKAYVAKDGLVAL